MTGVCVSAGKGQADILWPLEGLQPGHGQADWQFQGRSFAFAPDIIERSVLQCVISKSSAYFYMHYGRIPYASKGGELGSIGMGGRGGGGGGGRGCASTRI